MNDAFEFVGGPFNGRRMMVPGRAEVGLELRVYPTEPWAPGSSYMLGKDGRFTYIHFDSYRDQEIPEPTGTLH